MGKLRKVSLGVGTLLLVSMLFAWSYLEAAGVAGVWTAIMFAWVLFDIEVERTDKFEARIKELEKKSCSCNVSLPPTTEFEFQAKQ